MFISAAFVRSWNLSALTLRSQGGGVGGGNVAQVDCQGKVFSIFRIFIASPSFPCCVPRCQSTNCFHFAPLRAFRCRRQVKQLQPPLPFPILPPPLGSLLFLLVLQVFQLIFAVLQQSKAEEPRPTRLAPACCVCVFFFLFSDNVAPTTCAPCCSGCCCFSCCLDASLCAAIHRKV